MTTAEAPVLLIEDDDAIGQPLVAALRGQGHDMRWARTAAEGMELASTQPAPALILLDLGLPDLDGVELCRRLRAQVPQAVIVVLSARAEDLDVVLGLEAGADDYLTKPFKLPVLLARIRAHLRRQGPPVTRHVAGGRTVVGRLVIDRRARRCLIDGAEVPLRPKEFELLAALVAEAGRAVSRERLMSEVWDDNWTGPTKTLDMHVSMLRHKLSEHGEDPDRITTLRGYGYRYEPPRDSPPEVIGNAGAGSAETSPAG